MIQQDTSTGWLSATLNMLRSIVVCICRAGDDSHARRVSGAKRRRYVRNLSGIVLTASREDRHYHPLLDDYEELEMIILYGDRQVHGCGMSPRHTRCDESC